MSSSNAIRPLVAGNWKMNGSLASTAEVVKNLAAMLGQASAPCDVLICPPSALIETAKRSAQGSAIAIGGQDCHQHKAGAHTGDISAEMLKDLGCTDVIVGHSERRADHGESSALVKSKAQAALAAGLRAIICVGETEAERDAGKTLDIVNDQLKGSLPDGASSDTVVIAYEPVWAIGTGRTPSASDVEDVHGAIRHTLISLCGSGADMRILYGGSVKPANAAELMGVKNVNGALVGGASLKAEDFNGIIDAYRR